MSWTDMLRSDLQDHGQPGFETAETTGHPKPKQASVTQRRYACLGQTARTLGLLRMLPQHWSQPTSQLHDPSR